MRSIFEKDSKQLILSRIENLTMASNGQWGKMTVSQMLAHCANALDLAMGNIKPKREFIGKLVGWLFKSSYSSENNFPKNVSTIKGGTIEYDCDFELEKIRLIDQIEKMYSGGKQICTTHPHPILGNFTPEEWGKGMYKHLDHHLRQFGV